MNTRILDKQLSVEELMPEEAVELFGESVLQRAPRFTIGCCYAALNLGDCPPESGPGKMIGFNHPHYKGKAPVSLRSIIGLMEKVVGLSGINVAVTGGCESIWIGRIASSDELEMAVH